jgi:hypothetical protein
MKWIGVAVLAIVGVLAAVVTVMYLTIVEHSLPSFLGHHIGSGHYHKRAAISGVIALAGIGGAIALALRITRGATSRPAAPSSTTSAGDLLATSESSTD